MPAGSAEATALRLGATIDGSAAACPSCGARGLEVFHEHEEIPVHSCRLVATADLARAFPRGRLALGFCGSCGFITNVAYDGSLQDYSVAYEETQGFSPRFQSFAHELAARWVDEFDLRGKKIVEIGCGKGEFLAALCELGENSGVGIDPSYVPERLPDEQERRLTFLQEFFSEEHLDIPADAIVCRHTLEHVQPVLEFMHLVRRAAEQNPGAVVLFELPDIVRVLREVAFWDIYYEHCSYFSCGSLGRLFRRAGFDVLGVRLGYDDQYIVMEARLGDARAVESPLEESVAELADEVERFRGRFDETLRHWRALLAESAAAGGRVVIWGAGSKGVSFLTTLGVEGEIEYAVDINPYKHGKFMPATGQEIVSPTFLEHYRPDLVIAMNSIYLNEIGTQLAAMNLRPRLLGV
jgi:SAM-dependent methyltransferase